MSDLRIGTRGSALALAQAEEVRARLVAAHGLEPEAIEVVVIRTSGDRIQDRPLAQAGGKGLFTKEIEEALIAGDIDLAVHSMKDMPAVLPEGLAIPCLLPREDPRDAFLSPRAARLTDLPQGAVVGSSSLRRQAQMLRRRPDLRVVMFRGNVNTRLRKLGDGEVDATILAVAGLRRLGLEAAITAVLEPDEMLPAVAQGAIGVEIRESDERVALLLAALNDAETSWRIIAERAFLAELDGSCRTPLAGLATVTAPGRLALNAMILTADGATCHETSREGGVDDGAAMGRDAGRELKARGGAGFFG